MKVSGSAYALGFAGALTGPVSWAAFLWDIRWLGEALGLVFGLAVVAALAALGLLTLRRALIVPAAFGLSWLVAKNLALRIYDWMDVMSLTGAAAGAVGAFIVALGFRLAFAGFRAPSHLVRTVVTGAVFGLFLTVETDLGSLVFFVAWQAVVGAALGWDAAALRRG